MEISRDLSNYIRQLKQTIRNILTGADEPVKISEFELIKTLSSEPFGYFDRSALADPAKLFYVHFPVFHCLYLLKRELAEEKKGLLLISPLKIGLIPLVSSKESPGTTLLEADPLQEYYLNLKNLTETSPEDVEKMMKNFWDRLGNKPTQRAALETLGCKEGDNQQTVKNAYRKLASLHHPDKGGDRAKFIAIRQAYESL